MKRIYIASPYRRGVELNNVQVQIDAAERLAMMGYNPFVPLLCHYWNKCYPHPGKFWLKMDFEWVKQCDALLRLPGESEGADSEVEVADFHGIPVYYSVEDLVANIEP